MHDSAAKCVVPLVTMQVNRTDVRRLLHIYIVQCVLNAGIGLQSVTIVIDREAHVRIRGVRQHT